jgi:ParB family chromosome partitioning protein
LSIGHAKAILTLEGKTRQVEAARKIVKRSLSVREAESLSKKPAKQKKVTRPKDPQISSLEEKLIRNLGTKVRIRTKGKKGKIEIEYYSLDELERLLDLLLG